MTEGYRTWAGLLLAILGVVGVFEKLGITQNEVSVILDAAMQLIGLVWASYGNYKAHQKIKELQ